MSDKTTCVAAGCDEPAVKRYLCDTHYKYYVYHGLDLPPKMKQWSETVGYLRAHERVYFLRGKAREYTCRHCGGPAAEWAYDWMDPHSIKDEHGTYSLDVDRYMPLCRPCHIRMDTYPYGAPCPQGHVVSDTGAKNRRCPTCDSERKRALRVLMNSAAASLGMTYTEYRDTYGYSQNVARGFVGE